MNPSWFGYSVGRWEGDSFAVDSRGFRDSLWLDASGHTATDQPRCWSSSVRTRGLRRSADSALSARDTTSAARTASGEIDAVRRSVRDGCRRHLQVENGARLPRGTTVNSVTPSEQEDCEQHDRRNTHKPRDHVADRAFFVVEQSPLHVVHIHLSASYSSKENARWSQAELATEPYGCRLAWCF